MKGKWNVFILGICLASVYWALVSYRWSESYHGYPVSGVGSDHAIYWHSANGDYETWAQGEWWYAKTLTGPFGWIYQDSLKPVFYVVAFGWLPLPIASRLWTVGMILVYSTILVKLLRTEHGWTMALVTLKPFLLTLQCGNIAPLLSLMATTVPGAILAGCVKPFVLGFVVLMALAGVMAKRHRGKADANGCDGVPCNGVAHTAAPTAWMDTLGVVFHRRNRRRGAVDTVTCKNCGTAVPLRWWATWKHETPCPNCNRTHWTIAPNPD